MQEFVLKQVPFRVRKLRIYDHVSKPEKITLLMWKTGIFSNLTIAESTDTSLFLSYSILVNISFILSFLISFLSILFFLKNNNVKTSWSLYYVIIIRNTNTFFPRLKRLKTTDIEIFIHLIFFVYEFKSFVLKMAHLFNL